MLSVKQRVFKTHLALSLETLVPPNNFYRQVQSKLDIDFVRELVAERYSALGRPSIDPVVFFKLHLIMFFVGYRLHYGVDGGKARIVLSCLVTRLRFRIIHRCSIWSGGLGFVGSFP